MFAKMPCKIKYKAYHDKKANASKLKEADYVYILQPKAEHQGSKFPFTEFCWIGPYIVEKVLPNNNYLVRKIGTDKRKCFIECECVSSHPANQQPIYDSSRKNINPILKCALITTICMQGPGSIIMNSQFLTPKIILQPSPASAKFQYTLTCQRGR